MQTPSTIVVVIVGFSLVLLILLILILALLIEGKIFTNIDKKRKNAETSKETSVINTINTPVVAVAPVIEQGVPQEVVAAITAALACMENGRFELRSITRAKSSRSTWNMAGSISYTEPF